MWALDGIALDKFLDCPWQKHLNGMMTDSYTSNCS